ncbi:MAG: LacI family DNA-binding transcriptional regulator [Eubacteriales bacterium]|nr:LacI family DNA-binding transcriptional regulator [Eubacteriales bacterium]
MSERKNSVTIKKIAEMAGVSRGTVDRALNNRKGVNPEVAKKIKEIAELLNYKVNILAKSLSQSKNKSKIGLIYHVNLYTSVIINEIEEGILKAVSERIDYGIELVTKCGQNFDANKQLELIDEILEEGISALIIVPINDDKIRQRINQLYLEGLPVILLTNNLEETNKLAYVGPNYPLTGRIVAGLTNIITNGKANLGIITAPCSMLGHKQRIDSLKELTKTRYPGIKIIKISEVILNEIEAYKDTKELLINNPQIDILWYAHGGVLSGLKAIKDIGLTGKIKIISSDFSSFIKQALIEDLVTAAISQNGFQQGYYAVKILVDYLLTKNTLQQKDFFIGSDIIIKENMGDMNLN